MKIPNKRKLQQILFNHLSEELYKCLQAMYYKIIFSLGNPLSFRRNLLERI